MALDSSNVYLDTVARLEPDIAMVDPGAFYASASISLKRIADSLEFFQRISVAALKIAASDRDADPVLRQIIRELDL